MATSEKPRISPAKLALAVRRLRTEKEDLDLISSDPIAIVGMGCRFPGGADSPAEFWEALKAGRDGIGEVPEGRWKDKASLPLQLRRGGYIENVDQFDAAFFGIAPREAQLMDPQQRLLLEVAWEALWDAGIDPASLARTDAGVFVAIYNNDYARLHFQDTTRLTAHGGIGSAHSVAAGRLSFLLNLKGPSLAVDSACSSSLVAAHLACQSLRNRECGLAMVGASSLKLLSDEVVVFSKWGMLSSDGRCKAFDSSADGFVPGEGSGVLILKRLSDALQHGDRVRAVIRGTAVNHDGKTTVLTAPNGLAQQAVLRAALKNAMLDAVDISYIETHGTGTALGDPIEMEAISSVYGGADSGAPKCVLGAVKTNVGHLEAAAGMAGMIKTVLCLEQGEIPRNLHFHQLNPEISLDGTRLRIADEDIAWARSEKPRAAGISSFGLGGTNGHVILEESPVAAHTAAAGRTIPLQGYVWQRERFWIAPALTAQASNVEARAPMAAPEVVAPLLGRRVDSAFVQGTLFETELGTSVLPYLADHSLGDRAILPFAAFLEMASAAVQHADDSGQISIRDFVVREPLFLPSNNCRAQVLVADKSVTIASASGDGWKIHAKGSFVTGEMRKSETDLAKLRERFVKECSRDNLYRTLEQTGLRYGKAFRTMQAVWCGRNESLACLRLPDEMTSEAHAYGLHPTLLDGCLQTVAAARDESNGDLFLPLRIESFAVRPTDATEVWAHTKIVTCSEEAFSADITVMDAAGMTVARLAGLQAKRTNAAAMHPKAAGKPMPMYAVAWRALPRSARSDVDISVRNTGKKWLLIEAERAHSMGLAHSLEQQGAKCEVVAFSSDALSNAMAKTGWSNIVYDARRTEWGAEYSEWASREKCDVEFVLGLVKALGTHEGTTAPRLWIVFASAVAVLPWEDVSIDEAPLWGMARTLMLEHPEISPVLVDVGSCRATSDVRAEHERMLVEEMVSNPSEAMIAFRHGGRYVARLVDSAQEVETERRLQLSPSGRLEDLRLEPATRKQPEAHEVEIEVRASGLNFRDVLTALGMFAPRSSTPGAECAGTIARVGEAVRDWHVGDDVVAFAPASLQSFVNVPEEFVTRKLASMSYADAAGIPVAFLTAEYGLHRLANLSAGQRILIHAAAGGLGLAAVQLASKAGAEIFATAGSAEKRAFLQALGIKHIYDSRSLLFRNQVLEATGGSGVDVVLNSLTGDFIGASLNVLAEKGCFLEVGKRDLWSHEKVEALGKRIRYFPFDLGDVAMRDPKLIAAMLRGLMMRFSHGELQPMPTALYALNESADAFRTMAQARHIGKIVLGFGEVDDRRSVHDMAQQGTMLITGGLGALGIELARWLAAQGAKSLVLASRTAEDSKSYPIVEELRKQGVEVAIEAVDVASSESLQACLDRIRRSHAPLRAVFHAAGVLHDAVLNKESLRSYDETTAPKIRGAWNLHQLTQQDGIDAMVFFSSAASMLGSLGQGSYAAGNAFLDALAHHRASRGQRTLSVNWGAWGSAGMAARLSPEQAARWTRQGVQGMEPAAALATLQMAIETGRTQVAIMDLEWKKFLDGIDARVDASFFSEIQTLARGEQGDRPGENVSSATLVEQLQTAPELERRFLLSQHIKMCARKVLGLKESATIQDTLALQDLGLDSLMALEMKNELSQSLGLALPAGLLFDHPTVEDLTAHVLKLLTPLQNAITPTAQENALTSSVDLESISEEEAERLLMEELDRAEREKANA